MGPYQQMQWLIEQNYAAERTLIQSATCFKCEENPQLDPRIFCGQFKCVNCWAHVNNEMWEWKGGAQPVAGIVSDDTSAGSRKRDQSKDPDGGSAAKQQNVGTGSAGTNQAMAPAQISAETIAAVMTSVMPHLVGVHVPAAQGATKGYEQSKAYEAEQKIIREQRTGEVKRPA